MTDSHVYPFCLELRGQLADIRLAIVIGEEYTRFDDTGSTLELFGGHRIGLVAGQEGDVDVAKFCHFRNIFRVSSDIDAQSIEGEDISLVSR